MDTRAAAAHEPLYLYAARLTWSRLSNNPKPRWPRTDPSFADHGNPAAHSVP